MSRLDEVRLIAKIARMYYGLGIRQQEITARLSIHQSTVSRLLKRAREMEIVRISVTSPVGIFSEQEEALEQRFGLREAIVVDSVPNERQILRDLGAAAAFYLETTVQEGEVIGISSWSRNLLAMIDALHPNQRGSGGKVVQILGGFGGQGTGSQATHVAQRLAMLLGASPVLFPAPGIVGSPEAKRVLLRDPSVQAAVNLFGSIDTALVGIGTLEPSPLLAGSGNWFSRLEIDQLRREGAVGDICFRFFDAHGAPLRTPLHNRVVGIEMNELKHSGRVVAVAGGAHKIDAILGALRGRMCHVLITDHATAGALLRRTSTERRPATTRRSRTRVEKAAAASAAE